MKNIFKILICSLLMVSFSCKDSENTIDEVLDYETGAILRTISVENAVLNSSIPSTAFTAVIEEQDEEDGALLQEVRVLVELRDLTTDATTPATGDVFVKSIPASEFSTGPVGLPRTTISVTFGEMAGALGLSLDATNGYQAGDVFIVKLEVVLTDGRSFGPSSAAGIITGGFFSSPFQYNALISCSPAPGDYTITMVDTYGDGWQSDTGNGGSNPITIEVEDADGNISNIYAGMCSNYEPFTVDSCEPSTDGGSNAVQVVTIPEGALAANWFFAGDYWGEMEMSITGPNGNVIFSAGTGLAPGLMPIAVCAE